MNEVEHTRGGEILTVKPHYSKLKDGATLVAIAASFAEDERTLYRKIAHFPHRRRWLLKAGLGLSAVACAGAAVFMWSEQPEGATSQMDTTATVKAREVLSDPNKLRALGICSIELQKQSEYTRYLEMVGVSSPNEVTPVEYDAAARLAQTNNVSCQPQITGAEPGKDVSVGIVQFDASRACTDAAYYKSAVPDVENQKAYALNRDLAIATGQTC